VLARRRQIFKRSRRSRLLRSEALAVAVLSHARQPLTRQDTRRRVHYSPRGVGEGLFVRGITSRVCELRLALANRRIEQSTFSFACGSTRWTFPGLLSIFISVMRWLLECFRCKRHDVSKLISSHKVPSRNRCRNTERSSSFACNKRQGISVVLGVL
jgi:hypothetical protein